MKLLQFQSVRESQRALLLSVVILTLLIVVNAFVHTFHRLEEGKYERTLYVQKTFVDMLSLEQQVLKGRAHYANLLASAQDISIELNEQPEIINLNLFREREYLFEKVLKTNESIRQGYHEVQATLPELINEVRSIHSHHIVDIERRLRNDSYGSSGSGKEILPQDSIDIFSELALIDVAAHIQGDLLDIVSLFYELQSGMDSSEVGRNFTTRISQFYESVRNFEEFTFDSQDGVLAEKLLLIGRIFNGAFNEMLTNLTERNLLHQKMNDNRDEIAGVFSLIIADMKHRNEGINRFVFILQILSIIVSFLLICWLVRYAVLLSQNCSRTVQEALKIQGDFQYRIPFEDGVYQEFQIIFDALNSLAVKTDDQVRSLENMRENLARRLQERTAELVHMNNCLKEEIFSKEESNESKKYLEEQLIQAQKLEAIGTIAGGVAHDLNNILSGIVSYPELLLLDLHQDDPLYVPLRNIQQSGEKAALIVQDLLTLARRGVTVNEIIDLGELIEEYFQSLEYTSLAKEYEDVEIIWAQEGSNNIVKGSRIHLLKSIMNLVMNGLGAMVGGGTMEIKLSKVYIDTARKGFDNVEEGEYIKLSVIDNGVGMSVEVTEKLFEPFYSQKEIGQSGTGLGMAVVYNTVKDHGGYIDVHSEVGKGTAISLYLPMSRGTVIEKTVTEMGTLSGNNEHILVVDDIYEQRRITTGMLKRLNYTVATAAGGEEAVQYVSNNHVDLVILDMIMPRGMDGLETFQALRAVIPDIQVIIASGFSENDRVLQARKMGAGQYLRKPYSFETLATAIRETIQ